MNPSCPFCGEVLKAQDKQSYHNRGATMTIGIGKAWACKPCGKFWWRGRSTINKHTALNMDQRGVVSSLIQSIKDLVKFC